MKPVHFPQVNKNFVGPQGEADTQIQPLPAFNDGRVTLTFWAFESEEEAQEAIKNNGVWLYVTAGETTPPVLIHTKAPFAKSLHCNHVFRYVAQITEDASDTIEVYNQLDEDVPETILLYGDYYSLDTSFAPRYESHKYLEQGDYYFRKPTELELSENVWASADETVLAYKLKAGREDIYFTGTKPKNDEK